VVDDDADIREMIALALSLFGVETTAVADGTEALEQLRAGRRPGLILLDLMMPRLSGAQLLRSIRAEAALAAIPVVILSGAAESLQIAQAFGCPCLVKPMDIDELLEMVNRFVAVATPVDHSPRL
jgi:CheY-like chemotaxis protein